MGFDYTVINDAEASMYSQWAGWRRILSTVLSEGPEGLQVDNRQQNHESVASLLRTSINNSYLSALAVLPSF